MSERQCPGIHIFFPPAWEVYQPHITVPLLGSALSAYGVPNVRIRDLSIEFFHHVLGFVSDSKEKRLIDGAIECFTTHGSGFYDVAEYFSSKRVLQRALDGVLSRFGMRLTLAGNLSTRYSPHLSDGLRSALDETNDNPLAAFLRAVVCEQLPRVGKLLVGISVVSESQLIPALILAREVRRWRPDAVVVGGGAAISPRRKAIDGSSPLLSVMDAVAMGDGESILLEIVSRLQFGRDLSGVPGLVTKGGTAPVEERTNWPGKMVGKVTPAYGDLPLSLYLSPEPVLAVEAARGCHHGRCSFCSVPTDFPSCFQASGADIVRSMRRLKASVGARSFALCAPSVSASTAQSVARALLSDRLGVSYYFGSRVDSAFTMGLLTKLKKSGCSRIFVGVESGSDRILKRMCKGTTVSDIRRFLHDCCRSGIAVHSYAMVGFPTEEEDEAADTVKLLSDAGKEFRSWHFSCHISGFQLVRGTTVARIPAAFGVTPLSGGPDLSFELPFAEVGESDGAVSAARSHLRREMASEALTAYPVLPPAHHHLYLARLGRSRDSERDDLACSHRTIRHTSGLGHTPSIEKVLSSCCPRGCFPSAEPTVEPGAGLVEPCPAHPAPALG